MAQKYTQFGHCTLYKRGNRWHYYSYEGHKRVRKSTGKAKKSDALDVISQLMEAKGKSDKTFREYAEPFFIWETCPRVKRRLDEGKSIGQTHVKKAGPGSRTMDSRTLSSRTFKYPRSAGRTSLTCAIDSGRKPASTR